MKPKIGFKGVTTKNILNDLKFAIENRFDYLEIGVTSEEDFNLKPEIIKQVRNISQKNNLILFIHPSAFLPTSSPFPEISRGLIKIVKKNIILAKKLNANCIILHSGKKEIGPAAAKSYETLIKNLKEIVKLGDRYGIQISLENSTRHSEELCRKSEELLKVVNSVKGLKIVFDIGHANTTKVDLIKYFKKVRNSLINVHIHDNDGENDQHALIGQGKIDFKSFLKQCKNTNYYGPFILELYPRKNILKGREKLLNIWNQI